ncbi:MAG: septum site-determining protein MinD [Clostridia bacterium]
MARKIVLTSGKGGVGKTTVCAGLGARLAAMGFRVLLIDVDLGLNNLDVVMGVENKIVFDIVDVIQGRCRPKQALIQDEFFSSLYVMPSAHSFSKSCVTGENIKNVVGMMDSSFDYILIDCPAGVESGFHRAVFSANEALIVVTPHISSIRDADKVLGILSSYNLESKGLIINRIRGDMVLSGDMIEPSEIVSFLKIPLVGVVPEDDLVSKATGIMDFAKSPSAGRALSLIAENIHTGSKKIFDFTMKYRGLWGAIKTSLKRKL